MRILRRLSLSSRLTLLALATLAPIVVLTVVSYLEAREERKDEAIQEAQAYAESLAAAMNNFARDLDALTLAAALALGNSDEPIGDDAQAYLRALAQENPLFRAIFITDLEGRILVQDQGDNRGLDLSSRPYIQALKGGAETVWSGGLEGLQTGQVTVAYGRLIRDRAGEPKAFLVVAFYASRLAERLSLPDRGHVTIVDQNGRVVFSWVGPNSVNRSRAETGSPVVGDDAGVQAALRGERVAYEGAETPFDSGRRFGLLLPVPEMDWAISYTRSQQRLEDSLQNSFLRDLAVLGIISLLSIGALVLAGRQISRPLRALAAATDRVKLGMPLALAPGGADPDVARLQRAFTEMHAAVEEREARLAEQADTLRRLAEAGASIAASLDFQETVQAVTDAGTRLTGAAFGAFFYNVTNEEGESYQLFTLSGADREAFERFGMPRNTEVFGPTFRGEGVIRSDDITADPRYGKMAPHYGMPKGHLPVRSYLAAPVFSGRGEVLGGLFFGHPERAVFTDRHEQLVVGIAAWATIALDNARLYEESQRTQEALRRASAAKDEFLGLVSHEMRTPITIIGGAASHLIQRRQTLEPADEDQLVQDIYENSQRLAQLVENLLGLARIERLDEAEREPILVGKAVTKVLQEFRQRRPGRQAKAELPADDAIVLGSQLYLEQIIGNLLSNADKYSPAGEPIEVKVSCHGTELHVAVMDRGPGLSADDEAHLFEPYYRGSEAKKRATGFGLGLAVCRGMAEAMGAHIGYCPRPGGGSVFALTFPHATTMGA